MPGPGLDLLGAEELAEVADIVAGGRAGRHAPDHATVPAAARRFAEAGPVTLAAPDRHGHAHLEPALDARVPGRAQGRVP